MSDDNPTHRRPVHVVSSRPLDEDWDPADCLCQGKVPEDKRIDYMIRVFNEKRRVWQWRSQLRYHQDCPIHGTTRKPDA